MHGNTYISMLCRRPLVGSWTVSFLVWLSIFLGGFAEVSAARSVDPQGCTAERIRLGYGGLVFCFPTGSSAPKFQIESPDILVGSQYWIEGHPASFSDVEAYESSSGTKRERATLALFRIVPVDHVLLRTDWQVSASFEIKKAFEGRGDAPEVTVSVFMGETFGQREIRFRETKPPLFEAALTVEGGGYTREYRFLAPLNDKSMIDYVLLCGKGQQSRICFGQFLLAKDVVTISMDSVDDAEARHIFEAMRTVIRSSVLIPKLSDP